MIRRVNLHELNPGWMFLLSFALHLLLFFLFSNIALFRPKLYEATPYYVDLVTLPTSEPSPAMHGTEPSSIPAATVPQPASPPAMSLPVKSSVKPSQTPATSEPIGKAQGQEALDFLARLSRLEHKSEAKHQAAALESLKRKSAASSQSGTFTGSGTDSGSDYGTYIQSRLKDALATTIVYRTRQPETAVHLYIDRQGKLVRSVIITPSKDKLFNDSVMRAIEKAKSNFSPPPKGAGFDKLYVFSPQEVLGK
jgi:colicin import membrane protein